MQLDHAVYIEASKNAVEMLRSHINGDPAWEKTTNGAGRNEQQENKPSTVVRSGLESRELHISAFHVVLAYP
jgi:hypothetical protein